MLHRSLPLFLIATIISFVIFNFQAFKRDLVYKLNLSGDTTTSCCSEEEVLSSKGDFDENEAIAIFNGDIINYPKTSLAYNNYPKKESSEVLGTTNAVGEEKWIEISLSQQMLRAWEGNRIVMEFPISSGKWYLTPKGDYNIWYKTRRQKMEGGSKELGTYYYLPNVPHNMFFYKGYAIHGAYWHNNFGQPMSHGCVNSPLASVAELFEWAGPIVPEGQNYVRASAENPGTRVFVH